MPTVQIKYDDLDLTEVVSSFEETLPHRINAMQVPKRHGLLVSEVPVMDARRISLRGRLVENTAAALRDTIDTIEKTLVRNNKKFTLWDDRFLYCYKNSFGYAFDPGSAMRACTFSIDFVGADPFWYSIASTSEPFNLSSADTLVSSGIYKRSISLDNQGSGYVYPIITVVAGASPLTTIIVRNITTGRNFTYTGTVAASQQFKIDNGIFTVTNNAVEDLTNWTGAFLWFDPGVNSMEIEGSVPATYTFQWTKRWY